MIIVVCQQVVPVHFAVEQADLQTLQVQYLDWC
jgi:hypothetical protein